MWTSRSFLLHICPTTIGGDHPEESVIPKKYVFEYKLMRQIMFREVCLAPMEDTAKIIVNVLRGYLYII